MRKTSIFISVIAVIVLIASIYAFFIPEPEQPDTFNDYEETTSTTLKSFEPSECSEKKTDFARDECFYDKAFNEINADICEQISDDAKRTICFRNVAIQSCFMRGIKAYEETGEWKYERDACLTKDLPICNRVGKPDRKNYPEAGENNLKFYCFSAFAKEFKDPEICELITQPFIKQVCLENATVAIE